MGELAIEMGELVEIAIEIVLFCCYIQSGRHIPPRKESGCRFGAREHEIAIFRIVSHCLAPETVRLDILHFFHSFSCVRS
jgi:hypothetical protein